MRLIKSFTMSKIYVLILFIIFVNLTNKQKPVKYLGQICPPDMVFISGNDSIKSFFIGASQETNMNYVIYLEWLKKIFTEYPEIAKYAEPSNSNLTYLHQFNDPIINYSLWHPSLSNYPVVGVSWLQANKYSEWKTDRVNELINMNINEVKEIDYFKYYNNDNNFNTESYIAKQVNNIYEEKVDYLNNWRNEENLNDRTLSKNTPYFFTGFRLPTEEELEYAALSNFAVKDENQQYHSNYLKSFLNFNNEESNKYNYLENISPYYSKTKNEIKGIDNTTNLNIGNNIKEWTIDLYEEKKKHYNNTDDIFGKNNFIIGYDNYGYLDQYGELEQKDSAGSLRFRIMGVNLNGTDLRVNKYYPMDIYKKIKVINPDSINFSKNLCRGIAYEKLFQKNIKFPEYNRRNEFYYLDLEKYYKQLDTLASSYLDSIIKKRVFSHKDLVVLDTSKIIFRVVKSGTWKNPSIYSREKVQEIFASSEIGFRCVVQYNGFNIQPKYINNWNYHFKIKSEKFKKPKKEKGKRKKKGKNN